MFRGIVEIMAAAWVGLLLIDFSAKGGSTSGGKKYWPKFNLISISFSFFIAIIFLSAVFGADFRNSFWSNFERMEGLITYLHLLVLFFILAGTFKTRKEWFILFGISIAASFFLALYGLFEYFGLTGFGGGTRIMSTLGNPLYVAAYLTFNIFLVLFLWLNSRSVILKWLFGFLFFFELAIFFLTGSRGGFLGILAGSSILFVLWFFIAQGKKKKLVIGGLIILLVLIPILLNIFKEVSFIKNNSVISRFSNISLEGQTVQSRFTIWKMAFESFKQRPVLGWGVGNFIIPYAKNYDPHMFGNEPWFDRTHSMPFEWLSSTGIIGFLAYLFVIAAIFWAIIRGLKQNLLSKAGVAIFIGMFVAYGIQMFFVFDTLATYLMVIIMLAFLSVVSFSTNESWLSRHVFSSSEPNSISLFEYKKLSKKKKREAKRQQQRQITKSVSFFQAAGLIGATLIAILFIVLLNIRPLLSTKSLIGVLGALSQNQYVEAKENFEKALSLSGGTIGREEIREYLAMNMLYAPSNPESLKNPDVKNLYLLAISEMEKQVEENPAKNLKIKHNILLGQLYYGLGDVERDSAMLEKALEQYRRAIEFAPNYIYLYPVMANALAKSGNLAEAISAIEKAEKLLISVGRHDLNVFYSKPLFYAALGDYDKAYEALRKIALDYSGPSSRLDSDRMQNILDMARARGESSIPFLEKVYRLDTRLVATSLLLAQLYANAGDIEQAKFYANEALKNDPSLESKIRQFLNAVESFPK